MQSSSNQILKGDVPKSVADRGNLLYTSKVIHPQTQKEVQAQIYTKMIVLEDDYIPMTF